MELLAGATGWLACNCSGLLAWTSWRASSGGAFEWEGLAVILVWPAAGLRALFVGAQLGRLGELGELDNNY